MSACLVANSKCSLEGTTTPASEFHSLARYSAPANGAQQRGARLTGRRVKIAGGHVAVSNVSTATSAPVHLRYLAGSCSKQYGLKGPFSILALSTWTAYRRKGQTVLCVIKETRQTVRRLELQNRTLALPGASQHRRYSATILRNTLQAA